MTNALINAATVSSNSTASPTFITHPNDNSVIEWNDRTLAAVAQTLDTNAPRASYVLALESLAVHDALSAINDKPGYLVSLDAPKGISTDAAIAGAAERILSYEFPNQSDVFRAELDQGLQRVPDGPGESQGVAFGEAVADAIIGVRANDGADRPMPVFLGGTAPGEWRPTPPDFLPGLEPEWGQVRPFALESGDQFRPAGPPALTSPEYADAFNTVKRLGEIDSEQRTPDQTKAALFWSNDRGTYTTAGHWNNIATDLLASQGTGVEGSALLLAELNVALADDFIATWDAKYRYVSWRPITAIRQADEDGNPATSPDPSWNPLLNTPNFPNYVSGHASSGPAAAAVLTDFFGAIPFSATSPSLPGETRHFNNFTEAAAEDGVSRVYGGVHFGFSVTDGATLGQNVSNTALASFNNSVGF
jgi:PAP2 superfamily